MKAAPPPYRKAQGEATNYTKEVTPMTRFPSLSQLLGLGRDRRLDEILTADRARREEILSRPADPRLSGEEYRRRYLNYELNEAAHARAAGIGGGDL